MKHKKTIIIISLILFCIWYTLLPDYVVCADYNETCAGFREVTLDVVIYKGKYAEDVYEKIVQEHININGQPDQFVLQLYHTEKGYERGKPFRVIVYEGEACEDAGKP